MEKRRFGAGLAAVAALVAAGWFALGPVAQGSGATPPRPAERAASWAGDPLPLDALLSTFYSQRRGIHDVQERVIAECMRAAGFAYRVRPYPASRPLGETKYGLVDRPTAEARGYLGPVDDAPEVPESANVPDDPGQAAAYLIAMNGPESGMQTHDLTGPDGRVYGQQTVGSGCFRRATEAVYGSVAIFVEMASFDGWIQLTANTAFNRALDDPAFRAVERRWAACMAAAGIGFDRMVDPLERRWPPPRPGAEERAAATADVDCRNQVGLIDALRQAERHEQTDAVEGSLDALDEYRAAQVQIDERLQRR